MAIDPAAGKIYWANFSGNSIGWANLNGTGGGELAISPGEGEGPDGPDGLAIDGRTNTIYVADEAGGKIVSMSINGGSAQVLDTGDGNASPPAYPFLLKAPRLMPGFSVFPTVTGGTTVGATLTCTPGSWEGDAIESFLYRAPQSFSYEWLVNGVTLNGDTSSSLTVEGSGRYGCRVTARNGAGATSVLSYPAVSVSAPPVKAAIKLTKVKLDKRNGTATVVVQVSTAGTLVLSGKQVARRSVTRSSGVAKLEVAAKGKARKALLKAGKVKVKVKLALQAGAAGNVSTSRSITLRRQLKH